MANTNNGAQVNAADTDDSAQLNAAYLAWVDATAKYLVMMFEYNTPEVEQTDEWKAGFTAEDVMDRLGETKAGDMIAARMKDMFGKYW